MRATVVLRGWLLFWTVRKRRRVSVKLSSKHRIIYSLWKHDLLRKRRTYVYNAATAAAGGARAGGIGVLREEGCPHRSSGFPGLAAYETWASMGFSMGSFSLLVFIMLAWQLNGLFVVDM